MSRRTLRAVLAGGAAVALLVLAGVAAHADPTSTPGQPIPGKADNELFAGVGADAFAELSNNVVTTYNAQQSAPPESLESFDAVNPATGAAGEQVVTKPGCSVARPNGANAGITAITQNLKSTVDTSTYCIDWVRSSRSKGQAAAEQSLIFYAQSRDAVSYAVVGNAYAPTTPLTTGQLKDIFECTDTDWSQVGGQPGPIHLYLPPTSAATYTFFLQAIGSSVTNVNAGCSGLPTVFSQQQNDGRTMNGDPLGIAPYAVTKWAAQSNGAPGIADNRGGTHIGTVNVATSPLTTQTLNGVTYQVLNPAFTDAPSASFGRFFYNVVRNDAPQHLKDVFKAGGFLCQNQDAFLVPFGNTPLGDDTSHQPFCGQES